MFSSGPYPGKQDWRIGMNLPSRKGAQIIAKLDERVLCDIDSLTVAMEVGIR